MAAAMERTRYTGIFKRGSRYVVPFRHRGAQKKQAFRTLAEAREFKGRLATGGYTPTTRQTVEEYADEWLPTYQGRTSGGLTERTRAAYRVSLDQHALPFLRRTKMAEVDRKLMRRLVADMEAKGLAPASIKKHLVPLAALFATAVDDGDLRANPAANLRINSRRQTEEVEEEHAKAMTRAQLGRFLAAVPERHRLIFVLLAHTGLRISEAIGLDVGDVAFGAKPTLGVRRQSYRGTLSKLKTRNGRRDLPLSPELARALWSVCAGRDATVPIFMTRTGGRLNDGNLRKRVMAPAGKTAGVDWIGFHTFRHSCASLLIEEGRNIKQVSGWLGHADPAFTLRTYVHLMDEGIGGADFLDSAVPLSGNALATGEPQTAVGDEADSGDEIEGLRAI